MGISNMIATGKKHGITIANSIVTRYMKCASYPESTPIVDFGSGLYARQSQVLQEKYPYIRAYDFPLVITESVKNQPDLAFVFDPQPFDIQPKVVLLSNVLNVQETLPKLKQTLNHVYCQMPLNSKIIFNLPNDPIKMTSIQSPAEFRKTALSEVEKRFTNVQKIPSACNLPIKYLYEATKTFDSKVFCKPDAS